MADPRKGTRHRAGADGNVVRDIVHAHLIECTGLGAKAVGCTGASFVTMGIGIWAAELAELDGKATAILLRALADIMDPKNTPAAKAAAESRRQYAVQLLHMAVDMAMNDAEGRA
ncbi:hypothetical protein SAMN04244548_03066 [Paracoccus pantotrophus]|nr:hypothetical protein SAMN04244548_03066 [Paracoccus pantotrophus]